MHVQLGQDASFSQVLPPSLQYAEPALPSASSLRILGAAGNPSLGLCELNRLITRTTLLGRARNILYNISRITTLNFK